MTARGPRRAGAVLLALTVEEREILRAAAARDDRTLAAWIRHVAMKAATEAGQPPTAGAVAARIA
jgi:hypothetical protein